MMIGAVVFVIIFVLFLLISLIVLGLPSGQPISNALVPEIYGSSINLIYRQLREGIIIGVIFGVIIWLKFYHHKDAV